MLKLFAKYTSIGVLNTLIHWVVFGSLGFAPEAKIVFKKYPIIRRIMRILINGGDRWGEVQLRHYSVHLKYSDDNKRDYVVSNKCSR